MSIEKALLGAGCFWGVEQILRVTKGVLSTEVGFAGGTTENPTYEDVCTGKTNHAEVVLLEFDDEVISYSELLKIFFRLHDPTTLNRQHNDIGTQYRSVIFIYSENQKNDALAVIKSIEDSHVFKNPIVTSVLEAPLFYSASEYHQDYLIKNPHGYMCHILRD
jgi:methionine-S-sulfoxide reductase